MELSKHMSSLGQLGKRSHCFADYAGILVQDTYLANRLDYFEKYAILCKSIAEKPEAKFLNLRF